MEESAESAQFDHKPRKKCGFWGCCAAFVRWVFILLFVVILLGGLYFKAPWKVLVLDAVLLALLTVVPKKKRKYGWLALAAAVLVVAVWIFIPEKDSGDWKPYTFDEEVAALNTKYGVPDDKNAAPYYEQIEVTDFCADQPSKIIKVNEPFDFNREKRGPAKWDSNDETLSRSWTAEEFPELAAWLETEKEKIAPFWQAAELEKCWFEVHVDPNTIDRRLQNATKIKKIAQQTVKRLIYKDLADNNTKDAIQKASALIQSSHHFQQQGSLIENLVGWAVYLATTEVIRDIVVDYDLDEECLKNLEKQAVHFEEDWGSLANRIVDYDYVQYKYMIGLFYEVDVQGDVRYTRKNNFLSLLSSHQIEELGKDLQQSSSYWQARKSKLQRFIRWLTYNTSLEELSDLVDEFYIQYRERLTKEKIDYQGPEDWRDLLKYDFSQKSRIQLVTDIAMPALVKVQKIYRRTATDKNATLIVVALKRYYNQHGEWPETLEPIKDQLPDEVFVDSLNGEQIAYMRPENCDSFILYSFGEDGIDDEGFRSYTWRGSEKKKDDYLMWPRNEDELKQMLRIEEPEEPEEENMVPMMMMPGMN